MNVCHLSMWILRYMIRYDIKMLCHQILTQNSTFVWLHPFEYSITFCNWAEAASDVISSMAYRMYLKSMTVQGKTVREILYCPVHQVTHDDRTIERMTDRANCGSSITKINVEDAEYVWNQCWKPNICHPICHPSRAATVIKTGWAGGRAETLLEPAGVTKKWY